MAGRPDGDEETDEVFAFDLECSLRRAGFAGGLQTTSSAAATAATAAEWMRAMGSLEAHSSMGDQNTGTSQ